MPTPSIQTLVTDAQQVLNLDSISAVRSVVAVALANANTGTPLNPNLTTQQLWNEFYQVVTKPKSDIESIIANQLMKFLYAPPAPGGVGADKQVIFNDGGVLAGDPQFLWNKTTNLLTITGAATITGDLTVRTTGLVVNSTGVGVGASPASTYKFHSTQSSSSYGGWYLAGLFSSPTATMIRLSSSTPNLVSGIGNDGDGSLRFYVNGTITTIGTEGLILSPSGNLGLGVAPSAWLAAVKALDIGSNALGVYNGGITHNAYYDNTDSRWEYKGTGAAAFYNVQGGAHSWSIANSGTANLPIAFTQAMTLDASGNLLVGATSGSLHTFVKSAALGSGILTMASSTTGYTTAIFYGADNTGANAANTAMLINKNNTTGRSINGAGTINASGADYAEYMTKASDFVLAKGGIAGIDANGKLTNVFADAVSFVVKSTDPSYVGNDKWGVGLEGDALESARQLVDRVAFAGQVPVNVIGAKAGDYIVPVVDGSGIKGIAVSIPTFEQYQIAVGKVIAVDADGRARIIVKVA